MKRITIPIKLQVQGPIMTKSSAIGALGVDAVMARRTFEDGESGGAKTRYYLPGPLMKGLLREAWQELSTVDERFEKLVSEWLGEKSPPGTEDEGGDHPARGRLVLSDFEDRNSDAEAGHPVRCRIGIDKDRGAADGGMLQTVESPYASGQVVEFEGQARFLAKDNDDISGLRNALERGLLWIEAAGGTRTSGFGQFLDAKAGPETAQFARTEAEPAASEWELRLRFREPVILSKRRIADNFFESGEIVPGGALKGAVAEMAAREPEAFRELRTELHAIGFTHAFPTERGGARPSQWPLSILEFSKTDIVDVIRRPEPWLRPEKAGAFDIDWKEDVKKGVKEKYGWPKLKWELRVRTAINSAKRKAEDEQLFAWQTLKPYGMEWIARVELSRVSAAARRQLEVLLRFGLEPIGKTKALAETTVSAVAAGKVEPAPEYVVTLQTPALLVNPGRRLAPGGKPGSAREEDLAGEFGEAWHELSGGALRIRNYFQRCALAGGQYFQSRFLGKKGQYRPYLISSEGSTFLLEPTAGRDSEARACLENWLRTGLPLSASVREFYGIPKEPNAQWRHCPYLPENGYGEIAVNEPARYPEE